MVKPAKKKISKDKTKLPVLIGSAMRLSGANHLIKTLEKYGCKMVKAPYEDKATGKWMFKYTDPQVTDLK